MAKLQCSKLQRPVIGFLLLLMGVDSASISSVYPSRGSTQGGTYLVISGSGFQQPVDVNPWDSQVVYVGSKLCKIQAHYTTSSQIVCVTSPASIPFESSGSLTVSVQIFSGLGLASTAQQTGAFRYDSYDSPKFYWARNWAGTGGDLLEFAGDVYPGASTSSQFDIRIGDVKCGTDEESMPLDSRRRRSLKQVKCTLPNEEMLVAGHYNVSMQVRSLDASDGTCPNGACFPLTEDQGGKYGYGYAGIVSHPVSAVVGRRDRLWGGTVDLATAQSYHFTVYPQVDSVEPSSGSVFGGNNLTLLGSTFSVEPSENIVTVGGLPCQVSLMYHCFLGR